MIDRHLCPTQLIQYPPLYRPRISLGCIQRGKIRKTYGIHGGACGDLCVNLCCPCCAVIQQYKEVEMRRDAHLNNQGYQKQQPMQAPAH